MKTRYLLSMVTAVAMIPAALPGEDATPEKECACMADMHKKMGVKMKAEDAELSALLADMNASTGEKKIAAMSAIINKLVQEKNAMQEKMAAMHAKMADDKKTDGDAGKPSEHQH